MSEAEESVVARGLATLQRGIGIVRSAAIYRGQPWKRRRALALYREFIRPGDLCFDIGAHLGDRLGYFLALGARVVAAEPQPPLMAVLRRLYGRNLAVTLVPAALGAAPGEATLRLDPLNPTVATLSRDWTERLAASAAFARVHWRKTLTVPVTTLDTLIDRHGIPRFTKIDVEGFEGEVLAGLNHVLPALSVEYVTASREPALQALDRLASLGTYAFNRSPGESLRLLHDRWLSAGEMAKELRQLPAQAGSGDIYGRLACGR